MVLPDMAPDGVVGATLSFGMTTLAEGRLFWLFFDDVELMDLAANQSEGFPHYNWWQRGSPEQGGGIGFRYTIRVFTIQPRKTILLL